MYPYSQEDIPPLTPQQQQLLHQKYGPPNYQPHEALSSYRNQHYLPQQLHTTVEISPSHGFEIKQTSNGYETYPQANAHQYNNNYRPISFQSEHQTGPVIVLRIPGPQKYASHLQALLQQYLESRAAEYIRLLQEQELQQQQAPQAHNYQSYSYEPTHGQQMYQNQYHQSYQPSSPHYQVQVQPAQIVYQKHEESTDEGTQPIHYSHDVNSDQQQDDNTYQYQPTYRPDSSYSQQTEENEHYYHSSAYHHSSDVEVEQQHQQYVYPKIPSTTESSLQITENFPSDRHTHAYFTKSTTKPSTYTQPQHHQSYQDQTQDQHYETYQQQNYQPEDADDYYYDTEHQPDKDYGSPSEHSVITITQKTPAPYNYHAHPPQATHAHRTHDDHSSSASVDNDHSSLKGAKRQTDTFTQEQYAKLNKLISRMKKKVSNHQVAQKNKDE